MKIVQAIGFCCIIGIAGCGVKGNVKSKEKDIELPVLAIVAKDTLLHRSYVATINARQNVELRAKVSGFLEEILVDEGQFVRKGQPMFRLNDAEYKVQVSRAKAALSSAMADVKGVEVELQRVRTLVDKRIVSASELALAEAKLAAANAKVEEATAREEQALIHLAYTAVKAPFNGIIDRIPHKLGSLITEGTLLTTVSDIHAMHVYFKVSENEYLHLLKNANRKKQLEQPVRLILADGSDYSHTGKIETMEGEFEQGTGSIAFRATFPNPSQLLKHGASGKIMLTSTIPGALLIPQKAVLEIQDKSYVFVVNNDNTVSMKNFVPDTRIEDFILVKSGLSVRDRIIYEGVQNISEGSTIIPRPVSMDSLLVTNGSLEH
jgi:membrane fusion protein (multidrug efflux system)